GLSLRLFLAPPPPAPPPFPYTTLFRSLRAFVERGDLVAMLLELARAGGRDRVDLLGRRRTRWARRSSTSSTARSRRSRRVRTRRSEEHTSELQSLRHLVCRLLLEKKKK